MNINLYNFLKRSWSSFDVTIKKCDMKTLSTIFGGKLMRWLLLTIISLAFTQIQAQPCDTLTLQLSGGGTVCQGQSAVVRFDAEGGTAPWVIRYSVDGIEQAAITTSQLPYDLDATLGGVYSGISVTYPDTCTFTIVEGTNPEIIVNEAPETPGAITGLTTVCSGANGIAYSIAPVSGATQYNWTLPAGATIASGQNSNSITVNFGTSGGNITVTASNDCGTSTSSSLTVNTDSAPETPGAITGLTTVCSGANGIAYSIAPVSGATQYNWTLPAGATIASGQNSNSITVNFGTSGGNITVAASNDCGTSASSSLTVNTDSAPGTPGAITGLTTVCAGAYGIAYSIAPVSGATQYNWTLPAGATIASGQNSNSITVNFGTSGGNITVAASNDCGTSTSSSLTVNTDSAPGTPGAITGLTTVCAGANGIAYSIAPVSGATQYNWILPAGATIASGQNSNSITVNFGTSGGNITVAASNDCGTSASSSLNVTVNALPGTPGTITGQQVVCAGQKGVAYEVNVVSNATGYSWIVPTGAIVATGQGTNSITVDFPNSAFTGAIQVRATNACGNGAYSNALTVTGTAAPVINSTISGKTSICQNETSVLYSIDPVPSATEYQWQFPIGFTPVSGQTTPQVFVNIGGTAVSGQILVRAKSCDWGSWSAPLSVTVQQLPAGAGTITGPAEVCINQTGLVYSVPSVQNASSYEWTYPSGFLVNGPSNLSTITLSTNSSAVSGTITVKGINGCGAGNASSFSVNVPSNNLTVNAGNDITSCYNNPVALNGSATNQTGVVWTTQGNGTFINANSLNATYIPGSNDIQNGSVILTLTASIQGACAVSISDQVTVNIINRPTANAGSDITTCESNPVGLAGNVTNAYASLWSTSGDGTFIDASSLNTIYVPGTQDRSNGNVTLTLTAQPLSPCNQPVSDNLVVTLTDMPTANAGADVAHCGTSGYQIAGSSATSYSSLLWSSSGTGSFSNPGILYPVYTPSQNDIDAGNVTLTLVVNGTGNCSTQTAEDAMVMNLNREATVEAGAQATVCEGNSLTINDASATNFSSVSWTTSGTGTFSNAASLSTIYYPSSADISNGQVILTLTANSVAPCTTSASDVKTVIINAAPTVNAGSDGSTCDNTPYVITNAQATDYYSVAWTTSGSGSFSNPSSVNTTYFPSNNDIINGAVTLTLTAYSDANCNITASDDQLLTISSSPVCYAGVDGAVCENTTFTVTTATASPNANIQWTSSGSGVLLNAGSLTPGYIPSQNDALQGSVTLTMTVTGEEPCTGINSDVMQLVVLPAPIADAGANFSVCGLTPFTLNSSSALNYASITWLTSGNGTFANQNSANPTYSPSQADLANGSVTLTMRVTGNSPCNQLVEDEVLVTLNTVPVVDAGSDITICEGPHNITGATAANYSTLTWSSNGDGTFDNQNALNAIYTPGPGDLINGYATLTLTAIALPPCTDVVSDNVIFYIEETPVPFAGPDATICEGANYTLTNATASNYQTILWTTSGSGYFNNSASVNPVYYPSLADIANGSITLTMILENSPCQPQEDEMALTINQAATAFAGQDAVICEGSSYTVGDATAINAESILWTTNGSGNLQNPTTLNPTYIPSSADVMIGSVQLVMTVTASAPCTGTDTDIMVISITKNPTAFAGNDATICENDTYSIVGATASNNSSVSWSTSGDGVITGANTLFPTYTPGTIDATLGYAVLTLTAYGNAPCLVPATDQVYLTITNLPDINAGADITICNGENIALTGATAQNYSSLYWSTSGNGSFSDPTLLHPVYTPSPQDISNGTIILTLTGQPLAPCSLPTSDALVLNISKSPLVNAGSDGEICETGQFYIADASASNYSVITWTTMGDGIFSNQNSINPTYTPGTADIQSGSVLLYLTATSLLPCTGFVSDAMLLTIHNLPEISAGADAATCAGETYMLSGATALQYGTLTWTSSGSGYFSNNSVLNPVYTPSAADIVNGSVTLTLTATSIAPCTDQVSDEMTLEIEPVATANAGPDQEICTGSFTITTATASNYHTLNWISSGSSGTLLNVNTISPTYIPSALDIQNGSVVLTLTASANTPCTVDAVDQMIITIREITEVYAGQDATVCEGTAYTPSDATATNYDNILWTTSGTGAFTNASSINPTYTPSPADIALGWVNLILTATSEAPCTQTVSDFLRLTLVEQAEVEAGMNATICEGASYNTSTALASNQTSVAWTTSGDGTFANASQVNTTYIPGNGDIQNGTVVLTLTAQSNTPCNLPVSDYVTVTIQAAPTAEAGPNASICQSDSYLITDATADNYASVSWSTSGNGTFLNGNTLNPEYFPGSADIASGSVTITLTAVSEAPCARNASDSFVLTVNRNATADAGANASVCEAGSLIISDATAANYATINWSTSGTGSFINGNSLNATYYPGAEDVVAGTVTLTLTATSAAPCATVATDTKVVTVKALPIVDAGQDGVVCSNGVYNITGATASNQASLVWSTSGSGQFSNTSLLNPSYTPSAEDAAAGSVILTLTALSNSPCTTAPSDYFILTIHEEVTVNAGADDAVCEDGTYTVTDAQAANYVLINWTSNGSGVLTGANGLNPSYTPSAQDALNGSVTLTMTATGMTPCGNVSDSKTIIINKNAQVSAGTDATVCFGAGYTLSTATATNYETILWSTSGSGQFSNPQLINPVYTPSAADYQAGQVVLTITATSAYPCNQTVSDLMVLQFNEGPTANAGVDATICEGTTFTVSTASAMDYNAVNWTTSGTGSFSAGNTLTPIYTPSASDLLTGYVTLTLHALGVPPCAEDTDDMLLTFVKQVTASAGADASVCEGNTYTVSDAVAQNYTTIVWTSSGTGTLINAGTLTPQYTASAQDIITGSVTLTLTANGGTPCFGEATSQKILTFVKAPVVNAGADALICQGESFTVTSATAANTSLLLWTSSGSGTFTGNGTLTPTYTPSMADFAAGGVTLTLTGNPSGPCAAPASDQMALTLVPSAVVNAGNDDSICEDESYTVSSATASAFSSILWTSTGSGQILNPSSLTPTYIPSVEDITAGTVTLTLTAWSDEPCNNQVSDYMILSISQSPEAYAGIDGTICEGQTFVVSGATATSGLSYIWSTNGTGSFHNSNTLAPTYIPSPADINNGTVTLTLTVAGTNDCPAQASDELILTINRMVTVNAGDDTNVCAGQVYTAGSASANFYSSVMWSTSGNGTFMNPAIVNATYTPGAQDIANGSVILTLTANANGVCTGTVSDMVTLSFTTSPVVNAGPDITACEASVNINGALASNYATLLWTTSGTGTLSNASTLTPTYTPSMLDLANGSVQLTLTATSVAPCLLSATDVMTITFSEGPVVSAGTDGSICENTTFQVNGATSVNTSNITWSTSGTGTFSNIHALNPVYTPGTADVNAGVVTLTLTGEAIAPCNTPVSDNLTLTISKQAVVNAGADAVTCESSFVVAGASAISYSSLMWSTSGSGSFLNPATLTPTYIPSALDIENGYVNLTLTAQSTAPCSTEATDFMVLTINQVAQANAGTDESICQGSVFQVTTASASDYETISWTSSGSGTFSGQNTINPTYTPSASDIANGSVVLTLTATSTAPCSTVITDAMTLSIDRNPIVNAGADQAVCGNNAIQLSGNATYSSLFTWSTSGDGSFTNASTLTPTYLPGSNDIASGSVTITLTAFPAGTCTQSVTDNMIITIGTPAQANAGTDQTICGSSHILADASASNYSNIQWSTSGNGSFINGNTVNATYLASLEDITAGSVTLTITATGTAPCTGQVSDNVVLSFTQQPQAFAGADNATCGNVSYTLADAFATSYSAISWSTSGTGTFSNSAAQNPTYYPSATDLSSGFVTLTMTVTGVNLCNTVVSDAMRLDFNTQPTANAGNDISSCGAAPVQITTASASQYSSLLWTTNGTGTLLGQTGLTPLYTPSQNDINAGQVTLTLHAYANAPCTGEVTDVMVINLTPGPVVSAGADITVCENQNVVISNASATGYASLTWSTSGTGTFSNNTALNPIYYPSTGDIAAGNITLTLSATGSAPCNTTAVDYLVVTINKLPVANAGPDAVACGDTYQLAYATAQNYASLVWSTSGSGSFVNATQLNAVYTPSALDRLSGSVTLTLTVNGQAPCNNQAADNMILTIGQAVMANAGLDGSTCGSTSFTVTTSSASTNGNISWSTSGSGSFANQNTLNPTYTASAGDIALGSVILTMQVQGSAPCFNVASDNMVLTISSPATAYAGQDAQICKGTSFTVYGASATNAAAIIWASTGTGTFVSGNTLTPTYIPSFDDYSAGNVILSLTVIPQSPCSGSVSDEMLLTFADGAAANAGPDAEICFGVNFTVTGASAIGATTINWSSTGSGTLINNTTLNPTYIPSNADRIAGYVILSMTVNGSAPCLGSSTDNMMLTISSLPAGLATISGAQEVCAGQTSVIYSVTPPVQYATNYAWTVPAGATIVSGNGTSSITVDYGTTAVSGNIFVTPSSACGTGTTGSLSINILPAPANTGLITGPQEICANTSNVVYSVLPAAYATTYQWTVPSGATIVSGNGTTSITVSFGVAATSGNITVTAANNCQSALPSSLPVNVLPLPAQPVITANGPTQFCEGGSVQLIAPAGYVAYLWSNGETTPSVTVSVSGDYSVVVTDANGCISLASHIISVDVHILDIPEVAITGSTSFCEGESVILTAESGFASYLWNIGATTQSITVTTSGTYFVVVTDGIGCVSEPSQPITVTANEIPEVPVITADGPLTICEGEDVVLSAPAGYSYYLWSNGESTQSVTVTAAGNYTVQVGNAENCMSQASAPATITVSPYPAAPEITPAGPVTLCSGETVILTASDGFNSYLWSNGATTQSIVVTESGNYYVTGTNASGCSSQNSSIVSVTVNDPIIPVITANGPTEFCFGNTVVLSAPAGFASYIWSDGQSTQTITVAQSGDYSVIVTDENGCTSEPSNVISILVYPPMEAPVITASGSTDLCQGESVTLSAPSGYAQYAWSNGETTQNITVATAGAYYVVVSDINGCATLPSNIINVNVTPLPLVNAGTDNTICEGPVYQITGASYTNAASVYWTTSGTGTFDNPGALNPVYTVSAADVLAGTVNLTLTAYGCAQVSDYMVLTINSNPTVNSGGTLEICYVPSQVTGASAANYSSLQWAVASGDGQLINATTIEPIYLPGPQDLANGSAILTLTAYPVAPCNNPVTVTKTLVINEMPTAYAGEDATICAGSYHILTGAYATNFVSTQWSSTGTGTWLNANTLAPTYMPSNADVLAGSVTLTLTASNAGCPAVTDHMVLTIQPEAIVNAGPDGVTCEGSNFQITAANAMLSSSILWTSSGSGTFSNPAIINPVYSPSPADIANGSVTLTLTGTSAAPCSGSNSDAMMLIINQESTANAGSDNTICQGEQYVITDASAANYSTITWATSGSGFFLNGNTLTPTYIPSQLDVIAQSVVLTLIASNPPCADFTDSQVLNITPTATIEAGPDVTICQSCSHTVSGAFVNNAESFIWTTTGTGTLTGENTFTPTYVPSEQDIANGSVTLILTAESYLGCGTFSDQMVIYINQNPEVDFTWESVCVGQPTYFTVDENLTPTGEIATWHWNFGDGFYSNVMNPVHTFAAIGDYTVTLTATDTLGNQVIVSHIVQIQSTPVSFFSVETPNCFGSETQFINLSSTENGYITTWVWNYGDGTANDTVLFPNNPNVAHTYAAQGIYEVTLTVTNSFGCENSYASQVTVTPNPVANFYYSSSCENAVVDFQDASYPNGAGNIVSWSWDFGDPGSGIFNTSNLEDPQHVYSAPGIYTVTLYVVNFNNCSDTITKQVNAGVAPPVDFTYETACANTATSFYADSTVINLNSIANFLWEFGDGGQSNLQDPQHLYTAAGDYNVTLTITDTAGCSNTITKLVTVSPSPIAYFSYTEPACFQSEVVFNDLSSSAQGYIVTWNWNFGDGNTATVNFPDDPNVSHTYANSGTFNVTLNVITSLGCEHEVTRTISILPNPVANFTFDAACLSEATNFTDLSQANGGGQIINWAWDFGDPASGTGNNSSLINPSHIYNQPGTYTVLLTITTSNSCTDTISKTVVINPAPVVDFTATSGCASDTVSFVSSTLVNVSGTLSWLWEFGDGTTSNVIDPDHIYATAGEYQVTLTITDTAGCTASKTSLINVIPTPVAMFAYTAPSCSGSEVQFTDMSIAVASSITTWHWDFGDGNDTTIVSPANQNVAHTYTSSGAYIVTLTVTNLEGCDAEVSHQIDIITGPTANYEYEAGCLGTPVQFTDLTSTNGGSQIIQWSWNFGDPLSGPNNTSNLQNPVHTYVTEGNYTVLLTVTSVAGCQDTISQVLTVTPADVAAFNYSNSCAGAQVQFEPDSSVMNLSNIASWLWDFGDGSTTSALPTPTHVYSMYGTYNVTLTITNLNGCITSVTQPVVIGAEPTVAFTAAVTCTGNMTAFTDFTYVISGEAITGWSWNFGDPNAVPGSDTSSLQHPYYTYSEPGIYNVTLTATTESGCSSTTTIPVQIVPNPEAAFSYTTNACLNGTVTFNDESTSYMGAITGWSWEFEPYYYSSLQNPYHNFYHTDSCYNVKFIVTDMRGCVDTTTQEVCVPAGLQVDIEYTETCMGDSTWFNPVLIAPANDSLVEFVWNFDDIASGIHNTSTLKNPLHLFTGIGTYRVSLTATDINNCTTTVYTNLEIVELPRPFFTVEAGACDSTLYFTDLSSGNGSDIVQWIWNYGDGVVDTINSAPGHASHYYATTGTFDITLTTVTAKGCSNSLTLAVDKMPCLQADFIQTDTLICERHILTFEDRSVCGNPISSWMWDFGDGNTLSYTEFQATVEHSYENSGTYNVSLVVSTLVSGTTITDTIIQTVQVLTSPNADFSTADVCLNNTTIFSELSTWEQSKIVSWSWDFDDLQSLVDTTSIRNPAYLYTKAGSYRPMLTVTNEFGCTDTISREVKVNYLPVADFSYDLACMNNTTQFTDLSDSADASIEQWWWRFNDSVSTLGLAGVQNPVYIFTQTGEYNVELMVVNANGCTDTVSKSLTVFPKPTSAFSYVDNYENIQGQISFTNGSIGATAYEWDFGTGSPSFEIDPVVTLAEDGDYTISLIALNEYGCPDTTTIEYTMLFKGLWIPNAFSPNNPNEEVRLFKPVGTNLQSYKIEIFDTWGNLLWTSNKLDEDGSPAEGWNGVYNGSLLHQDTYMWKASAVFKDGTIWDGSSIGKNDKIPGKAYGTLHLIR